MTANLLLLASPEEYGCSSWGIHMPVISDYALHGHMKSEGIPLSHHPDYHHHASAWRKVISVAITPRCQVVNEDVSGHRQDRDVHYPIVGHLVLSERTTDKI
jgi:hypothetical protein